MSKLKAYIRLYTFNAILATMPTITATFMIAVSTSAIPNLRMVIALYTFATAISSIMNMVLVIYANAPKMIVGFGIPIITGWIVSLVGISILSRYSWTTFIWLAANMSVVITVGCYMIAGLIWTATRKGA